MTVARSSKCVAPGAVCPQIRRAGRAVSMASGDQTPFGGRREPKGVDDEESRHHRDADRHTGTSRVGVGASVGEPGRAGIWRRAALPLRPGRRRRQSRIPVAHCSPRSVDAWSSWSDLRGHDLRLIAALRGEHRVRLVTPSNEAGGAIRRPLPCPGPDRRNRWCGRATTVARAPVAIRKPLVPSTH